MNNGEDSKKTRLLTPVGDRQPGNSIILDHTFGAIHHDSFSNRADHDKKPKIRDNHGASLPFCEENRTCYEGGVSRRESTYNNTHDHERVK